jgi:hypothetical protein
MVPFVLCGLDEAAWEERYVHFFPVALGITDANVFAVKWYCNECKENMRRSRNGR